MRNTPNTRTGFAAKRHCKVIKAKPESFLLATDGPSAARAATTSSSIGWRAGEGERFGKRPRFPKLKSRYLTGKMPVPLIRRPSPALAPLVPRGAREKARRHIFVENARLFVMVFTDARCLQKTSGSPGECVICAV